MKDSLIYARVTSSSALTNNNPGFPIPAGAKIDLYENNVLKETMTRKTIYSTEYFVSSFKSIAGKKYTLKASATGLTNAEGFDIIPVKPSFEKTEFKEVLSNNTVTGRLVLKIKDPASVKNYYRFRVYYADTNIAATGPRVLINKQGYYYFSTNNFTSNDVFGLLGDTESRQLLFSDDQFDGKDVTLTINLSVYSGIPTYIAPELVNLSAETYKYLKSKDNQQINDGNPFTEAVIVYNNIIGGYGIVGGMADSTAIFRK
jgi:hypothetical protein